MALQSTDRIHEACSSQKTKIHCTFGLWPLKLVLLLTQVRSVADYHFQGSRFSHSEKTRFGDHGSEASHPRPFNSLTGANGLQAASGDPRNPQNLGTWLREGR